jgi:hypothetical protein
VTRIFISYRRSDTARLVDELTERLTAHLGKGKIYRDVQSLRAGEDWLLAIEKAVLECDVFLAVIGPGWLGTSADGSRRIDDRRDVVRMEIASAQAHPILIIPLLVDDAPMPIPEDLPLDIAMIPRRNGMKLRSDRLDQGVARLLDVLRTQRPAKRGQEARPDTSNLVTGSWVSAGAGGALLQYVFHPNGTYEFVGTLRQERASGSMVFEVYQAGSFVIDNTGLALTPFRASTSRRDPDFPEEDYVNRPEQVRPAHFGYLLRKNTLGVLTLTLRDTNGVDINYQRL